MRKLLPLALLALAGCNAPPMSPEQRTMLLMQMQAQQQQNMNNIANSLGDQQRTIQQQPTYVAPQFQAPVLTGPKTTYCRKSYGGQEVTCSSY